MYELAKKKNIGLRIVLGIVILFLVTQTLKFFLREPTPTLSGELVRMANELNKNAPIIIDSSKRFDNALVLTGNKIQYNYTLLNLDKSQIDTVALAKYDKEYLVNIMKTDPNASYFFKNKVDLILRYSDSSGKYICAFLVAYEDYK